MMLELAIVGSAISLSGGAGLVAYITNGHRLAELREKNRHELELLETKAVQARIEAEARIAERRLDADYAPEKLRVAELDMIRRFRWDSPQLAAAVQSYLVKHYNMDPALLPLPERPTPLSSWIQGS